MSNELTLGSLFDGSGGFPLGAKMVGIKPIWSSEIEPFPIRVTTKRMPEVKHLGDVSEIKGNEIEAMDIITFGSPCQDMSIAGKRAGLDGSRSNLFHEAIRIIKEMREKTNGTKPRYIVWENVQGAFSSNKGADFDKVLKEIASIKGYKIDAPRPNKWQNAGLIVADDFSLAWRVLDAQYWGVPQRRRRIFLVADFAGGGAGEILFKSEGLSGYSKKSIRSWQGTTSYITDSTGEAGTICLNDQGGNRMDVTKDITCTLRAKSNHPPCVMDSAVFDNHGKDTRFTRPIDVAPTYSSSKASFFTNAEKELANTLVATDYKDPPLINDNDGIDYTVRRLTPTECARLQGFPDWWCSDLGIETPTMDDLRIWYDIFETFRKATGAYTKPKTLKQITKWLKNPHSDSAEYKMWGNGVALPNVCFVLAGIVHYSSKKHTDTTCYLQPLE